MAVTLVVDDDPATRGTIESLLSDELGHSVLFAVNGETALVTYERFKPDLVITDLVMPVMGGVVFIAHLRAIDPSASIIAISGKGADHERRAKLAGASAVLSKPLSRAALLRAVEGLLTEPDDPWGPPLRGGDAA